MPLIHRIEASLAPYLPKGMRRTAKERAELAFWSGTATREGGRLGNDHYRFFYTDFFGLAADDYYGKSIIDVGCGPRGSLEWAEGATERVGLDSLAEKYRALGTERHAMRYIAATAEAIPFPAKHFDFVTCFNALDHVENLLAALAEIQRVLKPDGTFLLIVEVNHEPTVTEPVTVSEGELKELLEAGFDIQSWRTWPVPEDHNLYAAMRREAAPVSDGEPAIVAVRMTTRTL
jgi:SAM-dependent methyltransferase